MTLSLWRLRKDQLVRRVERLLKERAMLNRGIRSWQNNYSIMEAKWRHERQRAKNEEAISDGLRKELEALRVRRDTKAECVGYPCACDGGGQ